MTLEYPSDSARLPDEDVNTGPQLQQGASYGSAAWPRTCRYLGMKAVAYSVGDNRLPKMTFLGNPAPSTACYSFHQLGNGYGIFLPERAPVFQDILVRTPMKRLRVARSLVLW